MAEERIQIELRNDGLEAVVRVIPGEALEPDRVEAALTAAGVRHGIVEEVKTAVENSIHDGNFGLPERIIARGDTPEPGADGGIELDVEVGRVAYTRRADGSLDWFEQNALTCVDEGDEIGRVNEPGEGTPGKTVDGSAIPATPGKPSEPVLGDGIELTKEGLLLATRSGAVSVRGENQIDVLDHFEHSGDVDMSSGNLSTKGSLTVTGNVNTNFEVKATGDLLIKGGVFGGTIDAGGNVQVGQGISVGEKGFVDVGGDLAAHHAQMTTLRAGGCVLLATDSVGNEIVSRSIEVGKRIFGGTATCETRTQVLEAGSPSGAGTNLRVAEPFTSPREKARRKAELHSESRALSRGKGGKDAERHGRKKTGKKARAHIAIDRKTTEDAKDLASQRRALMQVAEVIVLGRVNPGVRIRFGSRRIDIDTALGATRFSFDPERKQITSTPL